VLEIAQQISEYYRIHGYSCLDGRQIYWNGEGDGKEPVRSGYFDVISLLADNTDKTQTKLVVQASTFQIEAIRSG
jgi:hypothetical protein